jgi:hypothetical protein
VTGGAAGQRAGRAWSAAWILAAAAAAFALAPDPARATSHARLAIERCACDPAELARFRDEIAAAPTLEEAQALATPPLELARSALSRARWLAPGSTSLAEMEHQLRAGERAVAGATTPAAVAGAFATAVSGAPTLDSVEIAPMSCSYTTLEIVAIVLGFILGIIPGIILLIILC